MLRSQGSQGSFVEFVQSLEYTELFNEADVIDIFSS